MHGSLHALSSCWPEESDLLPCVVRLSAQAAVIELLEDSGMPGLCVATASQDNAHRKVGEVLAEAVKVRPRVSFAVVSASWITLAAFYVWACMQTACD